MQHRNQGQVTLVAQRQVILVTQCRVSSDPRQASRCPERPSRRSFDAATYGHPSRDGPCGDPADARCRIVQVVFPQSRSKRDVRLGGKGLAFRLEEINEA